MACHAGHSMHKTIMEEGKVYKVSDGQNLLPKFFNADYVLAANYARLTMKIVNFINLTQ